MPLTTVVNKQGRIYQYEKSAWETYSRTYWSFKDMHRRCNDVTRPEYYRYGGRGIAVCERWLEYGNFLADMGEKPQGLTLDRIDNDKGYSKENCRWATFKQQCRNTRRNIFLTFRDETKTVPEWAEITGLSQTTIRQRVKAGWDVERMLTRPSNRSSVA